MSGFSERLIGYRVAHSSPTTLRIRSRQLPLASAVVLMGMVGLLVPLAFLADFLDGGSPFANLYGRSFSQHILVLLAFMLLIGMGLGALWLWPVKEELLLSHDRGTGLRATRNLFGRHRKVRDRFVLDADAEFRLWTGRTRDSCHLRPVLIDADGEPHVLWFEAVLLRPGKASTQRYLQTLADFLGSAVPEPSDESADRLRFQPAAAGGRAPRSQRRLGSTVRAADPAGAAASQAGRIDAGRSRGASGLARTSGAEGIDGKSEDEMPEVSMPVRLLLGLFGLFLAVFAFHTAKGLLAGLLSGRLAVSYYRARSARVYLWSEEPWSFVLAAGAMLLGLLLCAGLAYGCLKVCLKAPAEKKR